MCARRWPVMVSMWRRLRTRTEPACGFRGKGGPPGAAVGFCPFTVGFVWPVAGRAAGRSAKSRPAKVTSTTASPSPGTGWGYRLAPQFTRSTAVPQHHRPHRPGSRHNRCPPPPRLPSVRQVVLGDGSLADHVQGEAAQPTAEQPAVAVVVAGVEVAGAADDRRVRVHRQDPQPRRVPGHAAQMLPQCSPRTVARRDVCHPVGGQQARTQSARRGARRVDDARGVPVRPATWPTTCSAGRADRTRTSPSAAHHSMRWATYPTASRDCGDRAALSKP